MHVTDESALKFASETFRSVWPIELLFFLSRKPDQAWRVDTLARELRASVLIVTQGLSALQAVGFVTADQQYAYSFRPQTAESIELARALVNLYQRKPRAINRAIFAAPRDRIQSFADAFRLRKDIC